MVIVVLVLWNIVLALLVCWFYNKDMKDMTEEGNQKTVLIELRLILPESLAHEAEANGLLTPQALESLLRAELHRRHINHLFDAADRLAALAMPSLTEAEVEAEIQAVRNERRKAHASGG